MTEEFIGITENRMKHIISVANRCYQLAKEAGLTEDECRAAYMCGYLHDVGYAFSRAPYEHPKVGYELMQSFLRHTKPEVISEHGDPEKVQNIFLEILNKSDLSVDSKGHEVSVDERLLDILYRYSATSPSYTLPFALAEKLGLIE